MAFTKPGHKKRIYIKVTSDFDSTGFMDFTLSSPFESLFLMTGKPGARIEA